MIRIEREVVQVEEPETANTVITGDSEDNCLLGGEVLSDNSRDNWTNRKAGLPGQNLIPAEVQIASGFHTPCHATDTGISFQRQSKEYEANELTQFTFAATNCGHYTLLQQAALHISLLLSNHPSLL